LRAGALRTRSKRLSQTLWQVAKAFTLIKEHIMLKKHILIAAVIAGASGTASAYDIGRLTCQNVGQLAAQMVMARKQGVAPEEYLSAVNEKLPADANVERQLVVNIAKLVYTNDEVGSMKPEEAYTAFAQNCVQSQEQDQTSGQSQQNDQDDQNDNDEEDDNQVQ
jgi:hypothetical protein